MKLVIGIVGAPLAGKETFANVVEELLKNDGHSVSRHRFSDILRDTLDLWDVPHGRENEQLLAQFMVNPKFFGQGTLSNAVKAKVSKDTADVGMLDGVRWHSDEAMIRSFPAQGIKSLIAYVTANPDVRYARLQKRNRAGEGATTREMFDMQNKAENEIYIPEIGGRADVILENNYEDVEGFRKDVEAAYLKSIKPLL